MNPGPGDVGFNDFGSASADLEGSPQAVEELGAASQSEGEDAIDIEGSS
jgi:hypothetical protein